MDMIFDCLRLSYVLEGVCVTMRSTIVILAIMTLGLGFPTKTSDQKDIECVDIYKQVAFSHDLLQNHKLQKRPSEVPKSTGVKKRSKLKTLEAQVSKANCPEGMIPTWKDQIDGSNKSTVPVRTSSSTDQYSSRHEHAVGITYSPPEMYGTEATISVWDPNVEQQDEFSLAQIWITSGTYEKNNLNTIEVGWQVSPNMYQDNKPRLFIYWTSDTYVTGCYNLQCPGFIQTSDNIIIGGTIAPVSEFDANQFEITISVWKDRKTGNWWLSLGSNHSLVGYWPAELFSNLIYADQVQWGGEVVDSHTSGRQTMTDMGSGHFPDEGFGKVGYFRNLEIVDSNNILQPVQHVEVKATNPEFYSIANMSRDDDWGTCLFYGGPGFPGMHSGVASLVLSSFFLYFSFIIFLII
ncbi:uncharacterized protein LOC108851049 [Raphanus sativus]|uniref:Uncharacterized protein LOC108851049 n=1 Tax=Raphanus sativus TaxID=3726 RepID=A0A9W3DLH9_RAPSA|nr:uncharacterized protein LOC108851049 [Raphanus sativus]